LQSLQAAASTTQMATDLLTELPRLDAYHDALIAANMYHDGVPFSMRFGFYQGSSLGGAAWTPTSVS